MGRRSETQRGATIVEAAIIFPILIMLLVAALELGLAFKDKLTVSFSAREAARVGSLAGNDIDADCDIVQSVVANLGTGYVANISNIQIFKASQATGTPVPGATNTWTFVGSDPTDCSDWSFAPVNWPSTSRVVTVGPTSTLDILGVTINATHPYITNVPPFNGSINVSETAIQRLEPEAFE